MRGWAGGKRTDEKKRKWDKTHSWWVSHLSSRLSISSQHLKDRGPLVKTSTYQRSLSLSLWRLRSVPHNNINQSSAYKNKRGKKKEVFLCRLFFLLFIPGSLCPWWTLAPCALAPCRRSTVTDFTYVWRMHVDTAAPVLVGGRAENYPTLVFHIIWHFKMSF